MINFFDNTPFADDASPQICSILTDIEPVGDDASKDPVVATSDVPILALRNMVLFPWPEVANWRMG